MRKWICAAAALCFGAAGAEGVNLNTFLHGGSLSRPLAGTFFSASSSDAVALDAAAHASAGAVLGGGFESWFCTWSEGVFAGQFNSHAPQGLLIYVR